MKTCFLVYRINSQSLTESRELVKILSTAENDYQLTRQKGLTHILLGEYEDE